VQRGRKRGADARAIGRSRSGRTTKIHAVVAAIGRLVSFELSPGPRGGIRPAEALLEPLPVATALFGDTAYDSDRFRQFLAGRGTTPVIRPKPTRKNPPAFDALRYKQRNVIERAFSHLKSWRRAATRDDKLVGNFRATVIRAAILIWWTSLSPEPS
jgi:transposase